MTFDKRRFGPAALVLAAAGLWLVLGRHVPRTQTVRVNLGDAAPLVTEVRLRYAPAETPGDWAREVTLRYAPGDAPRVLSHEPSMADGDYDVQVHVTQRNDIRELSQRVTLHGSSVTVDARQPLR